MHIVANPFTFFFKADTTEHREKLRIIFPLVLGAINAKTLATQRELKDAEAEYQRRHRELEGRLSAARSWEAEVGGYYLQAQGLGLLPGSPSAEANWNLEKYILELQRVPQTVRTMDLPDVQQGSNEGVVRELTSLLNEEDRLGQEIGSIRRRLGKLDQLASSVGDFRNFGRNFESAKRPSPECVRSASKSKVNRPTKPDSASGSVRFISLWAGLSRL